MAGRPKGTPKTGGRKPGSRNKATADVKAAAQEYGEEAVCMLAQIMRGAEMPPAARVSAAKELLDRGYGKAPQTIDQTTTVKPPLPVLGQDELREAAQSAAEKF
ncbi:hypothetical protein [Frateuria terrea]|uniref:Uncharacterized protein n=1 Tax=Frateuria terrea TaxID=529704 RepID=A0A1H6ZRF8_9GAMM|nr:hypothetical protein [Frateuria terrea]SEJ55818.1 hypothetical protein SAMN04487997_0212 [Frateuria terrea]SFP46939.1 hypothetical protein SAMN02927913_2177 [Frateuria terrea]